MYFINCHDKIIYEHWPLNEGHNIPALLGKLIILLAIDSATCSVDLGVSLYGSSLCNKVHTGRVINPTEFVISNISFF
jgi:hypothetical protein